MMRHVTAIALCMCLILAPSKAHAGLPGLDDVAPICKASMRNFIICLIVEEGIERAIKVTFDALANLATGNASKLEGSIVQISPKEKDDIRSGGIPWPDLKSFLVSIFGSKKVDDAQARAIIQASCQTKLSPICAQLGFPSPDDLVANCSSSLTQSACKTKMSCAWKDGSCVRSGAGTKDLLKNPPKD